MAKIEKVYPQMADDALKLREEVESYPGLRARLAIQKARTFLKESKKKNNQNNTAWSLLQMGMVLRGQRRYTLALQILEQSRAIFSLMRNNVGLAISLYEMSFCNRELGKNITAKEYGRLSVQIFQEMGRTRDLAWAYDNMSVIEANLYNRHESLSYAKKARAIFTEFKSSVGLAWNACNLGNLYSEMGFFPQAEKLFSDAARVFRELDNLQGLAWATMGIGTVHRAQYRFSSAEDNFKKAKDLFKELDLKDRVAYCLLHEAAIKRTVGRDEEATLINKRAVQLFTSLKNSEGVAWALLQFGQILKDRGQYLKAWQTLRESLHLHSDVGQQKGMGWASIELGQTYLELNDLPHARECFIKAKVIGEKLDDGPIRVEADKDLARIHLEEGYLQKGIGVLEATAPLAQKLKAQEVEAENYLEMARFYLLMGEHKKGRQWVNLADSIIESNDIHRFKPLISLFYAECSAAEEKIQTARALLEETITRARQLQQRRIKTEAQLGLIQILIHEKSTSTLNSLLAQVEKDIRVISSRKLKAKFLLIKGLAQFKVFGKLEERYFTQAVNILASSGLAVFERTALAIQTAVYLEVGKTKEQIQSKNDIKDLLEKGPVDLHLVRPNEDPHAALPVSLVI